MKKVAVLLLFLMALAAAEEVSLQRAATLAVGEYPDLGVQPKSIPSQLSVLEDGASYWIIEFDDVWVPVRRDGKIMKEERETIVEAYGVHYAMQKIIEQREKPDYITSNDQSLRILLGDVETKEAFLRSSQPQLPASLQEPCQRLIDGAFDLKVSIQLAVNSMVDLSVRENDILFRAASGEDFNEWKGDFRGVLDALDSIVGAGNDYNSRRVAFNLAAQQFLNESDDTAKKQMVQSFTGSISITNIPGSLPGLQGSADKFRHNFLEIQLSDQKIGSASSEYYIKYREHFTGQTISFLQGEAEAKVNSLRNMVPFILTELGGCVDDISPRESGKFSEMNESYHKAFSSYNEGVQNHRSDEAKAKNAYLNAISWSEKSQDAAGELEGVSCPERHPEGDPQGFDVAVFLTSAGGIAMFALVVALGAIYWWNKKKKEGEDYYEDGYSY